MLFYRPQLTLFFLVRTKRIILKAHSKKMQTQGGLLKKVITILKRKSIKLDNDDMSELIEYGVKMSAEDISALTNGVPPEIIQLVHDNPGEIPISSDDYMGRKQHVMEILYNTFPQYHDEVDAALQGTNETLDKHYKSYVEGGEKGPLNKAVTKTYEHAGEIVLHKKYVKKISIWKDILSKIPEEVQKELKLTNRIKKFMERSTLPTRGKLSSRYGTFKREWDEIASIISPAYARAENVQKKRKVKK